MLSIVEGPGGCDPCAVALPATRPGAPGRVGGTTDGFGPVDPEVAATVSAGAAALADLGLTVEQVDLPVCVQLVSRWWTGHALLAVAERLEAVGPVRGRRPPH